VWGDVHLSKAPEARFEIRAPRSARLTMALIFRCPKCGAPNEVKSQKIFNCWKCLEAVPDDVANEIRFALKRRMPRALVVTAGVVGALFVMSAPNLVVSSMAIVLHGDAKQLGGNFLAYAVWGLAELVCLYAIWREHRWVRWPILLTVGATALALLLGAGDLRPFGGTIDLSMPLVLGPIAVALTGLFVYLVWFFFFSRQARDYYAAVAISKPTPILKKRAWKRTAAQK
jgi:hypothetical protein